MGTFCCFEVTIGVGKNSIDERVDYITYDTKGIWRCYEIKVSKTDFYSKAKKTFVGHYNYYVIPKDLYEDVKHDIPPDIGVYTSWGCLKKPKKRKLGVNEQILKDSMIRSLYREAEKLIRSEDKSIVERLEKRINYYKKESERHRDEYSKLLREVYEKCGTNWRRGGN